MIRCSRCNSRSYIPYTRKERGTQAIRYDFYKCSECGHTWSYLMASVPQDPGRQPPPKKPNGGRNRMTKYD
jgi:hypothetical protein